MPDPIIECKFHITDSKVKEICLKSKQDKPGVTMGFSSFCITDDSKDNLNAMCKMIVDVMQTKPTQRLSVSVHPEYLDAVKANINFYIKNKPELTKIFQDTEFKSTAQKVEVTASQPHMDVDIRATFKDKNGATLSLSNNTIKDMEHHTSRDLFMRLMKDLAQRMWFNNASIQSVTLPSEYKEGFKIAVKNYLKSNKEKDTDKSSKLEIKLKQLCDLIDKLPIIDSTAEKKMTETSNYNRSGPRR